MVSLRVSSNRFSYIGLAVAFLASSVSVAASALPPPEDLPEEVARTEIIVEARSPITGQPLTAVEYAELEAQLEADAAPSLRSTLPSEIREIIFLLQVRRTLRTFIPFIP